MRTRTPEVGDYSGLPDDEVLDEQRSWWRSLNARQLLVYAVVAAAAAALVIGGHFGSRTPQAALTPQPSGTEQTDDAAFRPLSLNDVALHCPPTIPCTSEESVPADTLAAVHEYLPGSFARRTLSIDRIGPNRLYYRAVNATSGLVELLIIVTTPDKLPGAQSVTLDPHPGAAIRYARRDSGRYEIQVQYTGPPGGTPAVDLAERLAADPRLITDN